MSHPCRQRKGVSLIVVQLTDLVHQSHISCTSSLPLFLHRAIWSRTPDSRTCHEQLLSLPYQTGKQWIEDQIIKCWWLLYQIWAITHSALSPSCDLQYKLGMLRNDCSLLEACAASDMWVFQGDRKLSLPRFSFASSVQIKWKLNHSAAGRIWCMTKGDEKAGDSGGVGVGIVM